MSLATAVYRKEFLAEGGSIAAGTLVGRRRLAEGSCPQTAPPFCDILGAVKEITFMLSWESTQH